MACRQKKETYDRKSHLETPFPIKKTYREFSSGFVAPIPDIPYNVDIEDYRRATRNIDNNKSISDKKSLIKENVICTLVIFSLFLSALSIESGIRHYHFDKAREKIAQIDECLQRYQAVHGHDVPLKARVQRDVYALTYFYRKDDVFPREETLQALKEVRARLRKDLPKDESLWTAEQCSAYEWVDFATTRYGKNILTYRNSFLDNIYNEIISPDFLTKPVASQRQAFPQTNTKQRIYS